MPASPKYQPISPSRFMELLAGGVPLKSVDQLKLLEVDWLDAASRDTWTDIQYLRDRKDLPESMRIRSLGYLVSEDDESITLAGSISASLDAACSMQILKRCIVSQRAIPKPADNKRSRKRSQDRK